MGIRKSFTVRVVKQSSRLPREVVDAPSLETFSAGEEIGRASCRERV